MVRWWFIFLGLLLIASYLVGCALMPTVATLPGIPIDRATILQLLVFPLLGAHWYALNKRIERIERKLDTSYVTSDLCETRHEHATERLARLEATVNGGS